MPLLTDTLKASSWRSGSAPIAVVMISLNESHNVSAVLESITGWAQEVFFVDSYSKDETVDIALHKGAHVVQRRFRGFGDQWNFALSTLSITAPWVMKLDPDERLSDELKQDIQRLIEENECDGISMDRHLWFMNQPLPIRQRLLRVWRTGNCKFTPVSVNEHPIVEGVIKHACGDLAHHDSPDLDHWLEKQNRYTTAEAVIAYAQTGFAETPRLFGRRLQQRMWLKANFRYLPFRFFLLFLFYWLVQGTWRSGWVGFVWARLRCDVMRMIEYKRKEMEITGKVPTKRVYGAGAPDSRVPQYD
jgi:glycosyltransferase involved in cell wall biosynthesis